MSRPRIRFAALLAIAASIAALPASAQQGAGGGPDAVDLALAWARGGYASPVICRFGDEVERGIRRVVIASGPRSALQRVDRVSFVDLGASGGTRCHDELGAEEKNVVGSLLIAYTPKRPRSDTPQRDLEQELKSGPLPFAVVGGKLRIGDATQPVESLPEVDFEGGKLWLGVIERGSDDARRLGDFASERRLRVEIESRDGTRFGMPLALYERR
jgi:hypothetical protein